MTLDGESLRDIMGAVYQAVGAARGVVLSLSDQGDGKQDEIVDAFEDLLDVLSDPDQYGYSDAMKKVRTSSERIWKLEKTGRG